MLFPWVLGWDQQSLAFDVALHVGTLLAVLAYYHRDFARLAAAFLAGVRERRFNGETDRMMSLMVIVGTVPAGVLGFLFESRIEEVNERPAVIGGFLIFTGVLLVAAQFGRGQRKAEALSTRDAIFIGFGQALALIPGISRAGATITAGIFRGLRPDEAARFSFLLSVPIIIGAATSQAFRLGGEAQDGLGPVAIVAGVITAAVSAFIAIHLLLKLMASRRISLFAYYCFAMGGFILVLAWFR